MTLQMVARGQTIAVLDSLGLPHPTTAKSVRYWIDDDAGSVTTITDMNGRHTIDVSSLLEGLHTIHYQIIDSEDKAAAPYSGIFLILSNDALTAKASTLRYWFDDSNNVMTCNANVGVQTLDASTLIDGLHTLHYQVVDTEGKASYIASNIFMKLSNDATTTKASTLRYWFDDSNNVMTCNANVGVQTLDASALIDGLHTLHYQVVDTEGKASYIASNIFLTMKGADPAEKVTASKLIYWFDDQTETTTVEMTDGTQILDASNMLDGLHTIHYMVVCSDGTITSAYSSIFLRMNIDSQATIAKSMRYWFDDELTATEVEITTGTQTLDASHLIDGLHTVHYQLIDNKGAVAIPMSNIFLKMSNSESTVAKSMRYWFDDEHDVTVVDVANGTQTLDASKLLDGLHTVHYQLIDDRGAVAVPMSNIFLKMTEGVSTTAQSLRYWFDDETDVKITDVAGGTQTLDVSNLLTGLHTLHYQLVDDKGKVCAPVSGLFMKMFDKNIASGENAITQYMYWMNDNSADNKKVTIYKPSSPYQLITLLPMIKAPIRSSSFHFETKSGVPMVYAKNDLHVRFEDAAGYWADDSRPFIDYSVSEKVEVTKQLTEVFGKETFETPDSNAIKWYSMECSKGDSIAVQSSQATSIQIFAPSGEEVFNASGSESVTLGGTHAPMDGTYYFAVHDVTGSKPEMTLNYQHIDKYAILDYDVHTVGNGGCSTITFNGNGFKDLYAVDLVCGNDTIKHFDIGHEHDANTSVTFDFNGAATGRYDAIFHFTLEDRFIKNAVKVEEAKDIELATVVSYPSTFLRGTSTTYTVKITNKGNMTAYYVPLELKLLSNNISTISSVKFDGYISPMSSLKFNFEDLDDEEIQEIKAIINNADDLSQFIIYHDSIEGKDYGLSQIIMSLPPNSTKTVSITIKSSSRVELFAYTSSEWFPLVLNYANNSRMLKVQSRVSRESMCCMKDKYECGADIIANIAGAFLPPGLSCVSSLSKTGLETAFDVWCSDGSSAAERWNNYLKNEAQSLKVRLIQTAVDCITGYYGRRLAELKKDRELAFKLGSSTEVARINSEIAACRTAMSSAVRSVYNFVTSAILGGQCVKAFTEVKPNCPPNPGGGGGGSDPVQPVDPNDIYGFLANSGSKFVNDTIVTVPYRIEFENDTTFATASAHTVIVKDTLDASKFDLSSYQPTSIKIGDKDVQLSGDKEFVTTVDMRPAIYAIAQVEGMYDEKAGIATWKFTSLDPMSMEETNDVMQGFLPINFDGNGIGEVAYNINLKPGIEDGAEINNRASIVFDSNDAIMTPTWTNIMDAVAPTSSITSLVMQNDSIFDLSFSGEDNRSGVWKYTLYVQAGLNAPWWEVATDIAPDSIYTYKGFDSIDYGFCVLATDSAGNVEKKEMVAEVRKYALLLGDANADGEVNVIDLNSTVNYIMERPSARFNAVAADVNKSGKVNVADLNGIVNIIMSEETNESRSVQKARAKAAAQEATESLYSEDVDVAPGDTIAFGVYLDNAHDASSIQFDLMLPEGVSVVSSGGGYDVTLSERAQASHSVFGSYKKSGAFRVVAYSTNNQNFADSTGRLVTIKLKVDDQMAEGTYDALLSNIILATSEEEGLNAAGGKSAVNVSGTTSIRVINSADDDDEGYTLQGVKRQKHQKGLKVTKDKKELIK